MVFINDNRLYVLRADLCSSIRNSNDPTYICRELLCIDCPLNKKGTFKEYLKSMVNSGVISHEDLKLIAISNKEKDKYELRK